MNTGTDIFLLRQRELLGAYTSNLSKPLGYSLDRIRQLSHVSSVVQHDGCINSLNWSSNGDILVSGSDDCYVKLWKLSNSKELSLAQSIYTAHLKNIFCVKLSPFNENLCFSSGVDGFLVRNDISMQSRQSESILLASNDVM